jgi:M6 family metalloprotease-like protein
MKLGALKAGLALAGLPTAHLASVDAGRCKLPARQSTYLSLGFNYTLECAPSLGTLAGFMLFVDFPDAPAARGETPAALYGAFQPAAGEWYAASSRGRLALDVAADTARFVRMPARSDSYGWERGLTAAAHRKYIDDALAAYNRSVPAVDVLYVVPTARAAAISFSPTYMSAVRGRDGALVAKKATTFGTDVYRAWGSKALNHESGHTMCLPDLYPLPSGATGLYVGGWDMMGYINGPAPDYFAWNKWRLGWIDDAQVECVEGSGSTKHTVSALGLNDDRVKAVVVRRNSTAALVAEVRTKTGLDSAACATGVLLYTISTAVETGKGSIRVLDTTPKSGGCAGDELNDAPLSIGGVTSYTVAGWGVKVSLLSQAGDQYTVQIDVP